MTTTKPEVTSGTYLTKRVQDELHESEVRFRTMFEHASIGMSIKTLNGYVMDANPALCRMFGKSLEEIRGRQFVEMTHPEDVQQSVQDYAEILSGKIDSYETERRYLRSNGEVFWGRTSNSLVRNSEGTPRFIIHMLEDIDHRKMIQEELRESEARFRAMFDNASVGMALMSLDRRVISVNQAAQRILGYTTEEYLNMDVAELAHPDDRQIGTSQFKEMIAGERNAFQIERRYMHKDGRAFWARVTYSVVPDDQGKPKYLVGLMEDINEERLAKDRLAKQDQDYRAELEYRVEERTRALAETNLALLAEIAQRLRAEEALSTKAAEEAVIAERTRLARDLHDAVTQTLFSASLIAEVLPELWESDFEEARITTEELRQLTRGALAEMRTLLLELRPSALIQSRFEDLLKQLCEALIGRTRLPINLHIEGEGKLQPEVQVALYRIAQESLNNAAKYARASHVDVNLKFSSTGAALKICDDGTGFDINKLKPSSLGLRIMRERSEAIGAGLKINSTIGEGTQISVTWKEPVVILSDSLDP